jgi:hypothetical protein
MAELLDLDVFVPDLQPVGFTDKQKVRHEFVINDISLAAGLEIMAHASEFDAIKKDPSKSTKAIYQLIVKIVSAIAIGSDASLTEEFLMRNLNIIQGINLIQAAMGPIYRYLDINAPGAAADQAKASA